MQSEAIGRKGENARFNINLSSKQKYITKGAILFLALLLIYNSNPSAITGNDTLPTRYLPLSIINEGNLDLNECTFMYRHGVPYFLIKTQRQQLVSTFGCGVALVVTPLYLLGYLLQFDMHHPVTIVYMAKFSASCCVALSAVFLFLLFRHFVVDNMALLLTTVYALATSMWALASQALWQHGPGALFVSIALYLLARANGRSVAWAGSALAIAVICRPVAIVPALLFTIYVIYYHRQQALQFVLLTVPLAMLFLAHNWYFFGNPFSTGQGLVAGKVAFYKTGSDNIWGTSLGEGLLGHLLSPSRGLLVFSPVMIFALCGIRHLRPSQYALVRFSLLSALGILLINSKWSDWWGGWSYGYRFVLDILPLLVLGMLPIIEEVLRRWSLKIVFLLLLAFSIYVQVLGAFCYQPHLWNSNPDVDHHHYRLWSIKDSQLLHYMRNPRLAPSYQGQLPPYRPANLQYAIQMQQIAAKIQKGEITQARKLLYDLLLSKPSLPKPYLLLGAIEVYLGKFNKGLDIFNYGLRMGVTMPELSSQLSQFYRNWSLPLSYISRNQFDKSDQAYVQRTFFYKQIVERIVGNANRDSHKISAVLDWCYRNVNGHDILAEREFGALPHELLLCGYGLCDRSAWVFATLAQQLQLPAQIVYTRDPQTLVSHHTLAQVRLKNKFCVVDPHHGIIFKNQNHQWATLADIIANCELASRYSSYRKKKLVTAFSKATVCIACEVEATLPRMKILQQWLNLLPSPPQVYQNIDRQMLALANTLNFADNMQQGPTLKIWSYPLKLFFLYAHQAYSKGWHEKHNNTMHQLAPFLSARIDYLLGKFNAAVAKFRLLPKTNDQLYFLAMCYFEMGNYQQAIKCFTHLLAKFPPPAHWGVAANIHLGRCYETLGQYQGALQCYQRLQKYAIGDIEERQQILQNKKIRPQ